ncbi:MAG: arylamine N-acetyltransferase, partial [Ignavibacteria bacterium]|nr:arylamine N-acetyltransferase [Ignavibacteria bacterium]
QDSPTSHFRTRMLCTIATESGRITLSDNSLTITNNGKKIIEKFTDEDKFYSLLKAYFKIELAK